MGELTNNISLFAEQRGPESAEEVLVRGVAEGGADEQQSGMGSGVRREGAQAGALAAQRVLPAKVSGRWN